MRRTFGFQSLSLWLTLSSFVHDKRYLHRLFWIHRCVLGKALYI